MAPQTVHLTASLWVAAQWVMRHGSELLSGDLAKDSGKASVRGSAIAFPLVCRNRPIGVLVGLDPLPSAALPALSASLSLALRSILEAPAIALDNALSLQRLEAESVTADLTGLHNSRFLNVVLRREVKRASRSGRPLSLLFLDLDVVITGSLDEFFDFAPGRYCVAKNWSEPELRVGNTSVYRFPVGRMTHIYDAFHRDPEPFLARYRNSQKYISGEAEDMVFWPPEWCLSFKHSLLPKWPMNFFVVPKLPAGTKVVAFTGKPDPDEARDGTWPVTAAWKRLYKHVRATPWIAEHWR